MFIPQRIDSLVYAIILAANWLFAQETVIDVTGNDFTHDEYVGTYGRQILVSDSGDVHVVYQKSWSDGIDADYKLRWKNLTTGAADVLPFQMGDTTLPAPGVAYIGGGSGMAPVYLYYGMGGRADKWGGYGISQRWTMYRASLAKISDDNQTIVGLGVIEDDIYYYPPPPHPYPISMDIDPVNGMGHCLITNGNGFAVAYFHFDGTNKGEIYRMYFMDPQNDVPGKDVPEKYRRNGTRGADLAISSDGSEITIAALHPACNIWLHKGAYGGELWDDNFIEAMDKGSCINLFDTTGTETGDNFDNNDPKPYTDIQVVYDENDKLVVVYTATYINQWMDTSKTAPWANWSDSYSVIDGDTFKADTTFDWSANYTSMAGDTLGTFYDGVVHPKPQLRVWSEATGAHSLITESIYPMSGDILKFWEDGVVDSGYAAWGNGINDGLISHFNLIVNKDYRNGEPKFVLAYQQCNSEPEMVAAGIDPDGSPAYNYYSYYSDIFYTTSMDGVTWSSPVNITNTPDKDENDLSMHSDVIDNKIHILYLRDSKAGRDDWLSKDPDKSLEYYLYKPNGIYGIPIRTDQNDQVQVIYKSINLSGLGLENGPGISNKFELSQNYPNPFNPTTAIAFSVPIAKKVKISVYNIQGRLVETLLDKTVIAGQHQIIWNAKHLSSGIYFYRIETDGFNKTKKCLLVK